MRATFMPCSASGMAQPVMTSSMRTGSSHGVCFSTPCNAAASMSSGRVVAYTPLRLPTGNRVAATM